MNKVAQLLTLLALAVCLLSNRTLYAQYGGGMGSGGTSMGGGFGSSMGGGMGGNMSGMTSNGAFGQRTLGGGAGLMGGSNGFGSPTGNSGVGSGQGMGFGNLTSVGTGGGRLSTQSFVGNDPTSLGNFVGALQQATGQNGMYGNMGGLNGGLGQMGMMNNRNRNNQNFGGGQGNNSRASMSVPMNYTVGFSYPAPANSQLDQKLSTELSKSRGITAVGPIGVQMEGSVAVLHGTVATEHDRNLAAQLALLEPGVYQIRNELRLPSESQPQLESHSTPSNSSSLPTLPAP